MSGSGDAAVSCGKIVAALKEAEAARDRWAAVNWDELCHNAADDAKRILSSDRKERTAGKSTLASHTREWILLPDDEKIPSIKGDGGLLKMYQNHINTLTRQVEETEANYLGLYKVLGDLPDPALCISAVTEQSEAVDRLSQQCAAMQGRAAELETLVAHHEQELSELQNQEVTVSRLKEELREAKAQAAADLQQAADSSTAEWEAEREQILRDTREREETLVHQLAAQSSERTKQLQLSESVQDEIMTMQGRMAEVLSGQEMSQTLLQQENEALQLRVAEVQSDCSIAMKKLEDSVPLSELTDAREAQHAWEVRCSVLVAQLDEAERGRARYDDERERLQTQLRVTKESGDGLTQTIASLREELRRERDRAERGFHEKLAEVPRPPEPDAATIGMLRRELEDKNGYIRVLQQRVERFEADEALAKRAAKPPRFGSMEEHGMQADRFLSSFSRFLHQNRVPRLLFVAYFVFLHLLLFSVTYRLSSEVHRSTILRYPHRYHGTAKF